MHKESPLKVVLITPDDDASVIIGLRVMSNDIIVKTQRLHHKLKLYSYPISKVEAKCYKLSGHISNDGKQVNILTGQEAALSLTQCLAAWLARLSLRDHRCGYVCVFEEQLGAYQLP